MKVKNINTVLMHNVIPTTNAGVCDYKPDRRGVPLGPLEHIKNFLLILFMQTRAHVIISGSVQGVFFRSAIRNHAKLHNVKGWVRNTKDGYVEAVLEGDKDEIEEVIKYCKEGPSTASVADVKVEWKEPSENFAEFEIR